MFGFPFSLFCSLCEPPSGAQGLVGCSFVHPGCCGSAPFFLFSSSDDFFFSKIVHLFPLMTSTGFFPVSVHSIFLESPFSDRHFPPLPLAFYYFSLKSVSNTHLKTIADSHSGDVVELL